MFGSPDHLVAETCTWQYKTHMDTDVHAAGGIRAHNLSRRAAADPRLNQVATKPAFLDNTTGYKNRRLI